MAHHGSKYGSVRDRRRSGRPHGNGACRVLYDARSRRDTSSGRAHRTRHPVAEPAPFVCGSGLQGGSSARRHEPPHNLPWDSTRLGSALICTEAERKPSRSIRTPYSSFILRHLNMPAYPCNIQRRLCIDPCRAKGTCYGTRPGDVRFSWGNNPVHRARGQAQHHY